MEEKDGYTNQKIEEKEINGLREQVEYQETGVKYYELTIQEDKDYLDSDDTLMLMTLLLGFIGAIGVLMLIHPYVFD